MPTRPKPFRPAGAPTRREQNQAADEARGSARARGYDTRWDKASASHRRDHPLCQYCEIGALGPMQVKAATCTDHLFPHRVYDGVFWLKAYWVSSCNECHAGPKQAVERKGRHALDQLAALLGRPPLANAVRAPRRAGEGGVESP